jgi:hypothetical protein
MRICIGVFLLGLLFSCADLEQKQQLTNVNQLNKKVDSLLIVLNQVNDPKLKEEITQSQTTLSEFMLLAANDTIQETDARIINNYATGIELMANSKKKLSDIKVSLSEQRLSIQNLKSDIENGFGKRNEYDKNISFEQKKAKRIEKEMRALKFKISKTQVKTAILKLKTREIINNIQLKHTKS